VLGACLKWSRNATRRSLGREFDQRLSTLARRNSGHMLPESEKRSSNVAGSTTVFRDNSHRADIFPKRQNSTGIIFRVSEHGSGDHTNLSAIGLAPVDQVRWRRDQKERQLHSAWHCLRFVRKPFSNFMNLAQRIVVAARMDSLSVEGTTSDETLLRPQTYPLRRHAQPRTSLRSAPRSQ
jgi:hypothetical protein